MGSLGVRRRLIEVWSSDLGRQDRQELRAVWKLEIEAEIIQILLRIPFVSIASNSNWDQQEVLKVYWKFTLSMLSDSSKDLVSFDREPTLE